MEAAEFRGQEEEEELGQKHITEVRNDGRLASRLLPLAEGDVSIAGVA